MIVTIVFEGLSSGTPDSEAAQLMAKTHEFSTRRVVVPHVVRPSTMPAPRTVVDAVLTMQRADADIEQAALNGDMIGATAASDRHDAAVEFLMAWSPDVVEAPKTCGTCEQWLPTSRPEHLCQRFGRFMDADDGCIKGYAPTEPTR